MFHFPITSVIGIKYKETMIVIVILIIMIFYAITPFMCNVFIEMYLA